MSRGQTLTMTVRFTTKLLWKHLSTRESCLVNTWIIQGPARVSRGDRCILKVDGHPHHALHDIKEGVEKIEDGSMQTKLSRFLLKYRSTPHMTTGVPQAQLLMKRRLRTRFDLISPSIQGQISEKQARDS